MRAQFDPRYNGVSEKLDQLYREARAADTARQARQVSRDSAAQVPSPTAVLTHLVQQGLRRFLAPSG
ncbi:hypothetical protein DAERI_080084 [Deinococcus aerius]|uniref:Uncharacterized protein n=1 Tax=Deinococcus aerius TaxID=200253 RepID=A0A2I9CWC9_9DEIO|nr:hypothetical protein [Deinococcus aerius]GBF06293.1 hypothetical protein DAERI_080084 [Deinococcus aerius]